MIQVVAIVTAKPGQRHAYLQALRALAPVVRSEPGCIEYAAGIDAEPALRFQNVLGGDTFVVIEKWEDMAALKAHVQAPHVVAYGAQTRQYLARREIHILAPAD